MKSPPKSFGPPKAARFRLLVAGERTFTFELTSDLPVAVGSGAKASLRLEGDGIAAHHLALRATDEGVEVRLVEGNASLNDVQLSGPALARAGDEIAFGAAALVVLGRSTPAPDPERLSLEGVESVVSLELRRSAAHPRPFQLWLLDSPAAERGAREGLFAMLRGLLPPAAWGELGPRTLAMALPDLRATEGGALLSRVVAALGRAGIRFALGTAAFPEDGDLLERLYAAAFRKLEDGAPPDDEPVVLDPVMVRLWGWLERVAQPGERIHLWGEAGVGKSLMARALHQRSGGAGNFLRLEGAKTAAESVAKAVRAMAAGTLLLRPSTPEWAFPDGQTSARVVVATREPVEDVARASLWIPPLRARTAEILPLAELFLARYARSFGRERRVLSAAAQRRLLEYPWPGNVRELRNAMAHAVLASRTAEVAPEALPPAISRAGPAATATGDLRSTLASAEREALLAALAATRWNVTKASKQLGVPRRTVVYRMSKLGLRRPARR